jgi:hypothetical protein
MFVAEWRQKCQALKDEYSRCLDRGGDLCDAENWGNQQRAYTPSPDSWWCQCLSYRASKNHVCKHLIRLYIGDEGLKSNKPRQPRYGQVFRQHKYPILWVKDVHGPNQFFVHDCQQDSVLSISLITLSSPTTQLTLTASRTTT